MANRKPLRRGGQQFGRHRRQDAVVSNGLVAQGVAHGLSHQAGIASLRQQVLQASQQFVATGNTRPG